VFKFGDRVRNSVFGKPGLHQCLIFFNVSELFQGGISNLYSTIVEYDVLSKSQNIIHVCHSRESGNVLQD
jgi:hypothetical protein